MESSLEKLLVFACLELEGSTKNVVVDAFEETMHVFLENRQLFEKLPKIVVKTAESLKEQEEKAGSKVGLAKDFATNRGTDTKEYIEYFDDDALLIYDGIEASAFGRMSFIYRSKGTRFFLFETGQFSVLTPYSYIDHDGFQLENSIWEYYGPDFSTISVQDVRDVIHYTSEDFNTRDPDQFVCGELLKMLCAIKEKFHKDYYLEYLLTPPDVDKLSEFSKTTRIKLWDICLSQDFITKWGKELQHASMNILSSLEIPLSSGQLVNFVKSTTEEKVTLDDIMSKLQEIQDNVVKVNEGDPVDLFEMKPNFFGVGININEIYKRAKGALKKPNKAIRSDS